MDLSCLIPVDLVVGARRLACSWEKLFRTMPGHPLLDFYNPEQQQLQVAELKNVLRLGPQGSDPLSIFERYQWRMGAVCDPWNCSWCGLNSPVWGNPNRLCQDCIRLPR